MLIEVPFLNFEITECLGRPFSFERVGRTPCAVPRSIVAQEQAPFRKIVDEVKASHPSLQIVDPVSALCDDEWCYAERNGILLYSDSGHITPPAAMLVARLFNLN